MNKKVYLDDPGAKREIAEGTDMNTFHQEAIATAPRKNPIPENLSAIRFPDWVENAIREKARQDAAVAQFCRLDELGYNYEAEFSVQNDVDQLLEMNETIEP